MCDNIAFYDVTNAKGVKVGEIHVYAYGDYANAMVSLVHEDDVDWATRSKKYRPHELVQVCFVTVTREQETLEVECRTLTTGYDSVRNLRRMLVAIIKTDPKMLDGMTKVEVLGTVDSRPAKIHHNCPDLDADTYPKQLPRTKPRDGVRTRQYMYAYEAVTDVLCL
jgi:hypothetical protein